MNTNQTSTAAQTVSGKHIWGFLILTWLLSWPIWFASGVLGKQGDFSFDYTWLIAQIGVFGPSVAGLIMSMTISKELRRNSLRMLPFLLGPLVLPGLLIASDAPVQVADFSAIPALASILVAITVIFFFSPFNRRLFIPGTGEKQGKAGSKWIFLSISFFPFLFIIAWLFLNLKGGTWEIATLQNGTLGFILLLVVSFSHNLLLGGSLGEEIGWRGFLLPALMRRVSPLSASLLIGIVWAVWHAPVDLTAGFVMQGPGAVLIRIIWTLPLSIIFTWFYLNSRGSLLVILFLHTSIDILSDLGFQSYETALLIFFVLSVFAATGISLFSPGFRRKS